MALYNEMSMDDYNKLVARNQQRQSQAAAQNLANRQAALQAAQGKKQGSLVDTLVGLATGLKDKAVDAYDTAKTIGKTVVGGINQLTGNYDVAKAQKDDSTRRNEIAKQFGYNSYSDAINSGTAGDDFWNAIKENNKTTQKQLKDDAKIYRNNVGNVTNIDLNKAKGQALNTIDTVGMALPGGAGVAANILGGGLTGIGDEYKAAAAEGRNFNANNAKVNAIAGMAGGAAGSGAGGLLGKSANKAGGNALGKILGSQLGQGIGSGAAAGAAGAAAGTLAQGGSLQDALTNAWEGAKGGAVAGGAMAGTMGLAGNALNRIRGGRATNIAGNAPIRNAEPAEAQIVQKNRVEAPTAQRIEAEAPSTRRGIAITDLDAGEQPVNVRNARQTLKNNTKNPSYYYYPEEQSIKPIEIDANGNYNVTDGINTIKTINGKVGTYNGSGDWKGAKVFDGQDGRGIPEGYKLMANENAAPSNEYVAIVNRSGEKALIKLPQASDYDYERVGLATGTTRESLANSGLIESANDYKPSKPYTKNGRKYIDSVVRRADANLPEAKVPTVQERFARNLGNGDTLENIVARGEMGAGNDFLTQMRAAGVTPDDIQNLKTGAQVAAADNSPFSAYGMNSRQDLPMLDRQEYYNYTIGKIGRDSNANLRAEDIPSYMQDKLRNDAGKGFASNRDNESIMREVFGNNLSKEDMYKLYEELAQTAQQPTYTADNFGYALAIDPELSQRVQQSFLDTYNPAQKIDVQGGPAIADNIPVTDRTTRYTESTIPAKQYEQAVAKMPEAETTTPKTVAENATAQVEPELDYNTQIQRQKAQIQADKLKRQAIGGVMEQYGTTRLSDRIEGLPNAIQDMLDLGLADRAEIDLFSKKLASGDSELAKAIRTSLNDAAPIDGRWGFTWEQVFDSAGAASNEAAQKQIKSFYESQAKRLLRADKNGQFNRNDVYDFGKALEKEGYKKYDRGVRNQNTNTQVYGEALINMSQDIIGKATDGVDVSGKFDANKLKNLLPGNEVWANKVDALNANAKTVQDLRSAMASATKMNLLKQAEEYNLNTYGQNVGGKGKGSAAVKAAKSILTGKPLAAAEAGAEMVLGSNTAKQKAIKKSYDNYKKYQAQANGEAPTTPTGKVAQAKQFIADKTGKVGETAKNIAGKAGEKLGNATSKLNDTTAANIAIGGNTLGNIAQNMANRTIAKDQAEFANNRANAAQAQTAYDQAATDYTTALANQQAAEQNVLQGQTGNTTTLNRIAQAMDLAMAAGDINAYSQLADLYKQAYNIYEMQNPTAKSDNKALSANQSKALAASQQLEQLAQMTPNAGTVASNIPLLGNLVDLTGGNEYANQAEALATTLGYLLSGANIKESEAKRIGQSYVPSAFDSENVRQQKLDRARQLIQSYMSDTGAIQQ